jgi:hypothetical protein
MELSPRVVARLERDFRGRRTAEARYLLESIDIGPTTPDGWERICGAILVVADSDPDRLVRAAYDTEMDWRDVLVAAGLENDDWPERLDAALTLP